MKRTKRMFWQSMLALILCLSMFVSSTFAWFTDSAVAGMNIIQSGKLDVEMYWTDDLTSGVWYDAEDEATNKVFSYDKWEPGYTEIRYVKLVNAGNLALNYNLSLVPVGTMGKLAEVINVYYLNGVTENIDERVDLDTTPAAGLLKDAVNGQELAVGSLLPAGQYSPMHDTEQTVVAVAMKMLETAGNEYQDETIGDGFMLKAVATQCAYEYDSIDNTYDESAELPPVVLPGTGSSAVVAENGVTTQAVTIVGSNGVIAEVPAGVKLAQGAEALTLTVTPMEESTSNITAINGELLTALDVHIEGVAEDNTVPITVKLGQILPKNLNMGAYVLSHVEDGVTNTMTYVEAGQEMTAHNQFQYDPAEGSVAVNMATFSEVTALADTANPWSGSRDTTWYDASATELIIRNADQLAGLGDIVAGIADGIAQDSFAGKTVKLVADIDLSTEVDPDNADNNIYNFYPIGYKRTDGTFGGDFQGTFDGNGNTIANLNQNGWSMVGDYRGGYYNAAMGLFGYVNGGAVKNLTLSGVDMTMELTTMGCVAAYAGGSSTFENITLSGCDPQGYNAGVAGIVGSDAADGSSYSFKNITIDNTNTLTALWGTWDCSVGGLMGYLGASSTVSMDNCHVSAKLDVYNDVCSNDPYSWYRYCGMLIGTVDKVDSTGAALDMSNITANNCSVTFGAWNDYVYCELVKNSKATNGNDHQYSRLTEVASESAAVAAPSADYVVITRDTAGKYASSVCYHYNEAGELWAHEEEGTELVDGNVVLVEDKTCVYLPFNQLFGGYGWGVLGVEDYAGIDVTDNNIDAAEESVTKFQKADTAQASYYTDTQITIGELFAAVEGVTPAINTATVSVFVSPVGEESTVSGTYTANTSDWTKGTLTLTGLGTAKISITDYYYCTTTSMTVSVNELVYMDKFEAAMPETDYLYRVGNGNTVKLGSLFQAIEGAEIGNVSVSVAPYMEGASVSGTYTANTSDWTQGTVKFSGTGPVIVTITDDAGANSFFVQLEVVDGYNVTSYSELSNRNSVLLNDITMSSNGSIYLSNATLYGNGFTFDVTDGTYSGTGYVSNNYLVGLANAALDNVQIIGAVYTTYGAQAKDDYNTPVVLSTGNSAITNCFIANCASPVRVKDGNLTVDNTTLKGGNFANLDIRNGHVVLNDVTTVNQVSSNDTAEDGTVVAGLGIVIYYEQVLDTTTIEINGTLTQYNYLAESDSQYISDSNAQSLLEVMFSSSHTALQYTDGNGVKWVNTGIISMMDGLGADNVMDNRSSHSYIGQTATLMGKTGFVYTAKPTSITTAPAYATVGQGAIAPDYSFDYTTKNYVAKTDGSNDYCYEDNGTVLLSMDEGDTFNWDTSILTATKLGQTLTYTVSMNGTDYTGKTIPFNTTGNYTVTYTYSDPNNYRLNTSGEIETYSVTYTKNVHISVSAVKAAAKNATFAFGSSGTAGTTVTIGNNTYVMPNVSVTSSTVGSITVSGTTVYYPIVDAYTSDGKTEHSSTNSWYMCFPVFKNAVTITDYADGGTGDAVTYGSSTTSMPSTLSVTAYSAYNETQLSGAASLTSGGPETAFKYQASASASSTPKTLDGVLIYASPTLSNNARKELYLLIQYQYQDNAGATYYYYIGYHMPQTTVSSSCVTPETLITLADGSKKEVQYLDGTEQLLVWNHTTGKMESAPIAYIVDHNEQATTQEIMHLYFSDGSDIEIIGEHVFFDVDSNKYVTLDSNAFRYVGHTFLKASDDNTALEQTKLVKVQKEYRETAVYEVVTYEHLTCFTDDILSASAYLDKLLNIFDIVPETMAYDPAKVMEDIETYGLYTYADFEGLIAEEAFELYNAKYLKIAVGKGYIDWDDILDLIDIYFNVEVDPLQ